LIPTHRYKRGIRILERFISPFIARTLSQPPSELATKDSKTSTFLHNLARSTRDAKAIRDQLMAVLIAGRDTTAATLSWTVYELAHYPAAYARLRSEVLTTVGGGRPHRAPTYEHLKAMAYLTHVLNETLRLYPAVPYNLRAALSDTSLPGGPGQPDIAVLEGDVVCYSTLAMQRRADLYPEVVGKTGERFVDPGVFCPERWDGWYVWLFGVVDFPFLSFGLSGESGD
jgi:cytochrome P450